MEIDRSLSNRHHDQRPSRSWVRWLLVPLLLGLAALQPSGTSAASTWQTITNSLTTARYGLAAASGPCPGSSSTTCLHAIAGYNNGSLSSVEYDDPSTGATMALLTGAHLQRSGGRLTISWRLADRTGAIGFEVDGGGHRLTSHRIPVHASARYRVVLHTHVTGAVTIQVVHSNGSRSSLPVRSRRHGRS
jgi:hypothetical protein